MFERMIATMKEDASRKVIAAGLWAAAGVLVIVALAYFVGALHHWLMPKVGPIGADAILGASSLFIAGMLMLAAARYNRTAPATRQPASAMSGLLEIARQGTALRFGAELAQHLGPVQRVGLGLLVGFIVARSLKRSTDQFA